MLNKYISKYKANFDFDLSHQLIQEVGGIKIKIDVMEYSDCLNRRQKADILLEKNGNTYKCECIDVHDWDNMFYPLTLNNTDYLCFRKTLYGFTLINTDTLTEEFDYFPENVINDDESFIITEAMSFSDIIVFIGCYWADSYSYYAYDNTRHLFLNLSKEFHISADDGSAIIDKDKLILTSEDSQISITDENLNRLITEKGVSNF